MLIRRSILLFVFLGLPAAASADVRPGELPAGAKWYFHIDLEQMRVTDAGRQLYALMQGEVFDEVRAEAGVDLDKEADQITAYAVGDETLIVVKGDISQATRDKALGMGAATGAMDRLESDGDEYYYIKNTDHEKTATGDRGSGDSRRHSHEQSLNGLHHGAFFSFAVKDTVIVTSREADMRALLANNGRLPATDIGTGALLVLSADKSLIQAGMDTDELSMHSGWDSNIINNTEQLALLVADEAGLLAIKAQLVAAEKEMAESLASIVRGLIALQAFSDEIDPELSQFLTNTAVDVEGSTLTIKLALDPAALIAAIE